MKKEGYFSDPRHVVLSLSSDGAQIRQNSKGDGWFLVMINYNLDPAIRYREANMLVVGIIPGPKCPSRTLLSFFEPLTRESEEAQTHPGIKAYDAHTNECFYMRTHVPHILGDMPGSDKMWGFFGHIGHFGCRFCRIKGVTINGRTIFPHAPPKETAFG